MARKKKTLPQLKKDLWKVFSKVIKLRNACDGWTKCYTCDRPLELNTSGTHAGHWLPKGGYPFHYFNENNVRPQCYHCNINLSGNSEVFRRRLADEIGEQTLDEMYETRHESAKRTREWYEEKIKHYKTELEGAA